MKKVFNFILGSLRGFLKNPFWKSIHILIILGLSLAICGFLWYTYATKIKNNPLPFIFTSGLFGLNLILSNYLYNKEKLSSFLLIYTALFAQILMVVFLRYLLLSF